MARERTPDPAQAGNSTMPGETRLPGLEHVGTNPADLIRQAYAHRVSLKDALPDDPEFPKSYRFLWAWLTWTDVSDEKVKERATLICKIQDGAWSLAITDASMAASLAVSGRTLQECLQALDDRLGKGEAWIASRKKEPKLRDRKKK